MTKGFKEVNSSVNTLINNIDKTGTKVANLESKLENLKKGTVKTDAYKELEDSVKRQSAEYDKQIEKYNMLIAKQTELQNSNHTYGKEWEDVTSQITKADMKLAQMGEKLDNDKYRLQNMQDSGTAFQVDNEAVQNTSESLRQARNQLELYSQKLDELEGKEDKRLSIGEQLKKTFSGASKSLSSTVNPMKKFNDKVKGLAKRVFIFGIIAAGLRKVKDSLQTLLGSDKEVKGYMDQIKANLMLAFAPLYDAILPALKVVLQYVVKLTSYLAAFVSKLFGGADASKKLASNMASTATSAKKVQKALASIDEINAIDIETGDTGVTDAINNWQMNSNGFIDNMAAAIKDGDWRAIASSMSDLISTALSNINSFLKKVDWKKLGKNIGAFISGIKWGEIAINMLELAHTILSALADAFVGFAEEAPLAALALAIVGTLKLLKFDSKSSGMTSMANNFASKLMTAIAVAVGGYHIGQSIWKHYLGESGDEWITNMGLKETIEYLFEDLDSLKEGLGTTWNEIFYGSFKGGFKEFIEVVKKERLQFDVPQMVANYNNMDADAKKLAKKTNDAIADAVKKGDWATAIREYQNLADMLMGKTSERFGSSSNKNKVAGWLAKGLADATKLIKIESKYNISPTLGNLVNLSFSPVSRVPMLANGAVIPPNRQFLAMLGDQKHGTNIEAPLDTIVEAVEKANIGRSGLTTVNVQINGQTLFKIFIDEYKKQASITDVDPLIGI